MFVIRKRIKRVGSQEAKIENAAGGPTATVLTGKRYFYRVKNLFLFLANFLFYLAAHSQTYWQQQADYTIDVTLNDKEKNLDGFERILYTNHSPDTLRFIWFHLWPNAYKNDRTAFSDQEMENGSTAFYFSNKEQRGYINRLDFKVDGATAKTEDHPQHIDVIKVLLPKPLPPLSQAVITTPFHVKLPFNFSRGGYDGESFQVTQWYPKPAVYDKNGWHPMPYLDQGEFYSEFGGYDVRITVPKTYVVAATGELQNSDERQWLKTRSTATVPEPKRNKPPLKKQTMMSKKTPSVVPEPVLLQTEETKTLRFVQMPVAHDFAWFADKHFIVDSDTLRLPSGRTVNVAAYYTAAQRTVWKQSLSYAKEALRFYSTEVGEYMYNTATVVQGPKSFGGGMEYPTITVISPTASAKELDETIAHELGHNWFYGLLASNERDHPWMDEGMNSFYEGKYTERKYGRPSKEDELIFQLKATNKTDQPVATPSEKFSVTNYGLVAYHKTAEWMKGLEQKMGNEAFRQMMQDYFAQWKFKHPQPEDFFAVLQKHLGTEARQQISLLQSNGILPNNKLQGTSVIFPLKKGAIKNYTAAPAKDVVIVSPAVGFNLYDKIMLGGLATNYGSPTAKLNFLAVPLYATGSNHFTGLGKLNYAFRSDDIIRKTDVFVNASSFTMNDFKDDDGVKHRMRFVKVVPGVRFTFKESDPRSEVTKYIQWKTFLLNEQGLRITADSIKTPTDTVVKYRYSTPWKGRYLNQLQLHYQNVRALYPFDVTLQAEQGQDFIRTALTANYFFNYAKGGGLGVRFFAGKFSYLNGKTIQKQFANDRYHLNLTGANGYEDYTYSDYFIGRNRFDGFASQQIMIRDGGFKVRTDLLASKVGKTDDWLMAANFVSTVPQKVNPLSVLPIKIPLCLFADIGTYAEAWNRSEDADRFLFDGGLLLPLFGETINVYIPLFYSSVYGTYFKSTIPSNRFLKTISFSVNLYHKELKKLNRELEF